MNLATRIARRYALTFRSFHFITIISIISAVGIVVGTCALVCVLSIFNGFRDFSEKQLTSFDPHVKVSPQKGNRLSSPDSLIEKIHAVEPAGVTAPIVAGRAALMRRGNLQTAYLSGADPDVFRKVSGISKTLVDGKLYSSSENSIPTITIGIVMSNNMQLVSGDTVTIISPLSIEKAVKTYNPDFGFKAVVSGVFYANNKEYDELYIYTDDLFARRVFGLSADKATDIDIRIADPDKSSELTEKLKLALPDLKIQDKFDLHADLYNVMKMERLGTFTVIGLIVMIAVFNVFASLSMTVVEKRRDIAILKTMGAEDSFIRRIYFSEGLMIGAFGAVVGTLLGVLLCLGQIHYGWIKLDSDKYLIDRMPVVLNYWDAIITVLFALAMTSAAAIVPATRAAKTRVMNAMRDE